MRSMLCLICQKTKPELPLVPLVPYGEQVHPGCVIALVAAERLARIQAEMWEKRFAAQVAGCQEC